MSHHTVGKVRGVSGGQSAHVKTPRERAREAWQQTVRITGGMLTGLGSLVTRPEAREDVRSIVGIVDEAPEVQDAGRMWFYLAFLSLAIAIFNLLPLLPLDGGHLAFGIVEAVRRRPVPRVAYEQASIVGLGIIGVLFYIGLTNDLGA